MKLTFPQVTLAGLIASALIAHPALGADTVKIAYIDPLSGAFANVGQAGLKQFQFVADDINKRNLTGGPKLEIVGFDNKTSPQESLNVLKKVIDSGIRIITQGNGSNVAKDPKIKNVYLINMNYSFGQAVSRAAKADLARKRPDVKIVGDDFHPIGQVKDFSPYIAKMKAANADTVITGNWGNDMALLVKAAKDAGFNAAFYTYYGGGLGALAAIGEAGEGRVKQITEWHANVVPNKTEKFAIAFNKKYGGPPDYLTFYYLRVNNEMYMLAEAIKQAKSTDPKAIAYKLEGMKYPGDMGEVEMRAADHQLIQPLYISTVHKAYHDPKSKDPKDPKKGTDPEVKYDQDNSGFGFKTDARIEAYVSAQPTSCQMKRP